MKVLVGSVVLLAAGIASYGQQAPVARQPLMPTPPGAPAVEAKVLAELATAAQQLGGVKNAPFTADEVNESVQVLADGNRIVQSSSNKIFRNGEGSMRREMKGGLFGGVAGAVFSTTPGVTIVAPQANQQVILDEYSKVARIADLTTTQPIAVARAKELAEIDQARVSTARTLEMAREESVRAGAVTAPRTVVGQGVGGGFTYFVSPDPKSKYETRTEDLGTRDFEGVTAEGRRTITIIPAGAIGNERPIETVYERWYSKDLGMVVYSRRSDPRTGEQIYELKNIVRAEPDPALFRIPSQYTKVSDSQVYRPSVVTGKATTTAKPVQPVMVKNRPQN